MVHFKMGNEEKEKTKGDRENNKVRENKEREREERETQKDKI